MEGKEVWKTKVKKKKREIERHSRFSEGKEAITSGIYGNQVARKLFNGCKTAFVFEDVFPKYDASV